MKLILNLLAAAGLLFSLVYAIELSYFVDNTNIGNIRGSITDLKILNAFVRNNPRLPVDLRVTNLRDAIIYVSVTYTNRAIIGIRSGSTMYAGYVQVTFNGGPPTTEPYSSDSDSEAAGGNTWDSRFNLSAMSNLNRNLGTLTDSNDRTIIQAFLFQNQNLPNELVEVLRVRNRSGSSARLYVPEGSLRYMGEVVVFFRVNRNSYFHDELVL